MKFNMDIRDHFEFRIKIIDPDYDMIACMPNGTYLKKNCKDSLINNKDSTIFAERVNLDEKTGIKIKIIPMVIEEACIYAKHFNKVRKEKGWEPIEFIVLKEQN